MSTLPNLLRKEFKFVSNRVNVQMSKNQFFKFYSIKILTPFPCVTFWSTFVSSKLHSSTVKPVLFLSHCHVKILNNSPAKVLLSILEPLLFK